MKLYFKPSFPPRTATAVPLDEMVAEIVTQRPELPETPPSPWLVSGESYKPSLFDLDQATGRESLAAVMADVPLYRIATELAIDRLLGDALHDPSRSKAVRQAFAPEEPPSSVSDSMVEKYAFEGSLHFPIIASRDNLQLIDLFLALAPAAGPSYATPHAYLSELLGGHPQRLLARTDGLLWRGAGLVRMDRLIYDAVRLDNDPDVTFESYVGRGRQAAESLAIDDPHGMLAAWIQAERVQRALCCDIDAVLHLPDIRRLPRWVRTDIFRILEREAMKQVFAAALAPDMAEWPDLRRCKTLAEPIAANARGEVSPLLQQLLNQTLSADARYAGSADAFATAAELRWKEAEKLLGDHTR